MAGFFVSSSGGNRRVRGLEKERHQTRKAVLEFLTAQGIHALRAIDPRANDSGCAQDLKMMGARGLGSLDGKLIAGKFLLGTVQQMADNLETAGICQRLKDIGDFHAAEFRMFVLLHVPF